jgi:hypothetical protein
MRTLGIPNTTFVYIGYYYQNLGIFCPFVEKDNEIEIVFPFMKEEHTIPMVDVENDTGVCIYFYIFIMNLFLKKIRG